MLNRDTAQYKTEEKFVQIFEDVFGPAAAAHLQTQVSYTDIEGNSRYIDFVLESILERYAIEIDGESYHHPSVLSSDDYADQLVRQNSLTHLGWRILRWSDWQLQKEDSRVREHLSILLDTPIRLVLPQEHLPCKRGAVIDLFEHQKEALERLDAMRRDGQQIALLQHAVGAGKTTTAIEDARACGLRTLFLAHTHELIDQALERFGSLWPEATRARLGDSNEEHAHVVVGTVQSMYSRIRDYKSDAFGYIVIDEAHHATSTTYLAILRYFDPKFLLGLSGTPERADGKNALDVFREAAHRMDLETAVRGGVLCDVRCFRVNTNIDLKSIRFNGSLYRQKDLERKVRIPERDTLIVNTYIQNVRGRRAVVFCVSVDHAEEIARMFNHEGVPARAVSGRLEKEERSRILEEYRQGRLLVLCACDVLNEGWDSPETEVLMMGRPTLSRVVYQQQLGRGMRKYPEKDYLILFDFVDLFGKHNASLNIHRLLRKPGYRAGASVVDPDDPSSLTELPLHLWSSGLEQIDLFDWQESVQGLVTAGALSAMLRKSEGWVIQRWKKGEIPADEEVDLGRASRIPYFNPQRAAQLRMQYGLAEVTDKSLYDDFVRFVTSMDMTASYKPVWLRVLLRNADARGRARVAAVNTAFQKFYVERETAGLNPERGAAKMASPSLLQPSEVQHVINQGPFDRFARLDFVQYSRDRAFYELSPHVWKRLKKEERCAEVLGYCDKAITDYFAKLK